LPLFAGFGASAADATMGAAANSESVATKMPLENRNWLLMVSPLFVLLPPNVEKFVDYFCC
jgi:hypothetical protein